MTIHAHNNKLLSLFAFKLEEEFKNKMDHFRRLNKQLNHLKFIVEEAKKKMEISRSLQSNEKELDETMFLLESKLEEIPKGDLISVFISLLVSFSLIAMTIAVLFLLRR